MHAQFRERLRVRFGQRAEASDIVCQALLRSLELQTTHGALCHPNVAELMAHVDTNARDASRRDPLCFRLCGVAR